MNKKNRKTCADCGAKLTAEERDAPNYNHSGEPVCSDCDDAYEFKCCGCHEYWPDTEQGAIGNVLVVIDAEEADMPVGFYEIKRHPYYADGMLSMWFYPDALQRIGGVPEDVSESSTDGYPCGHLCNECSKKAKWEMAGCHWPDSTAAIMWLSEMRAKLSPLTFESGRARPTLFGG